MTEKLKEAAFKFATQKNGVSDESFIDGHAMVAFLAGAAWQRDRNVELLKKFISREPKETAYWKTVMTNIDAILNQSGDDTAKQSGEAAPKPPVDEL